jgi:hypothetical protein
MELTSSVIPSMGDFCKFADLCISGHQAHLSVHHRSRLQFFLRTHFLGISLLGNARGQALQIGQTIHLDRHQHHHTAIGLVHARWRSILEYIGHHRSIVSLRNVSAMLAEVLTV